MTSRRFQREAECLLFFLTVAALGASLRRGAQQWQQEDAVDGHLFSSNSFVCVGPIYFCSFYLSRASVWKTEAESHHLDSVRDLDIVLVLLANFCVCVGRNGKSLYQFGNHGTTSKISEQRQSFMSMILRHVEVEDPP